MLYFYIYCILYKPALHYIIVERKSNFVLGLNGFYNELATTQKTHTFTSEIHKRTGSRHVRLRPILCAIKSIVRQRSIFSNRIYSSNLFRNSNNSTRYSTRVKKISSNVDISRVLQFNFKLYYGHLFCFNLWPK